MYLQVDWCLIYRALLQKRPIIQSILLTVATPKQVMYLQVDWCLFYRALLQKRPIIVSILLTVATPKQVMYLQVDWWFSRARWPRTSFKGLMWSPWRDDDDFESYQSHWFPSSSSSRWMFVPAKPSHQQRVVRMHNNMIPELIRWCCSLRCCPPRHMGWLRLVGSLK